MKKIFLIALLFFISSSNVVMAQVFCSNNGGTLTNNYCAYDASNWSNPYSCATSPVSMGGYCSLQGSTCLQSYPPYNNACSGGGASPCSLAQTNGGLTSTGCVLGSAPGATPAPGPTCTMGTAAPVACVGEMTGLMGSFYEDGSKLTTQSYTCGPTKNNPAGTCGWWTGYWDGYFNVAIPGNYQFYIEMYPRGGMGIDLDNNGSVPCGSEGGWNYKGDRYFALADQSVCEMRCRPQWLSMMADGAPDSGDYDGDSCFDDGSGGHCQYVDENVAPNLWNPDGSDPDNLPDWQGDRGIARGYWADQGFAFPWMQSYQTRLNGDGTLRTTALNSSKFTAGGVGVGKPRVPVYSNTTPSPAGPECIYQTEPNYEIGDPTNFVDGHRRVQYFIWAERYLTAGKHKVNFWYDYNIGSSADTTSHYMNFRYRRSDPGGDPEFIETIGLGPGSCPFSPPCGLSCVAAPPTAPVLSSPSNGATLLTLNTPVLNWNATTNWGKLCPTDSKSYKVCVGTNLTNVTNGVCNIVPYTTSVGENTTTYNPVGALPSLNPGATYYWKIGATNSETKDSPVWSFVAPTWSDVSATVYRTEDTSMACTGTAVPVGWTGGTMDLNPGYGTQNADDPVVTFTNVLGGSVPVNYLLTFNNSDPNWYIADCQTGTVVGESVTKTVSVGLAPPLQTVFYITPKVRITPQFVNSETCAPGAPAAVAGTMRLLRGNPHAFNDTQAIGDYFFPVRGGQPLAGLPYGFSLTISDTDWRLSTGCPPISPIIVLDQDLTPPVYLTKASGPWYQIVGGDGGAAGGGISATLPSGKAVAISGGGKDVGALIATGAIAGTNSPWEVTPSFYEVPPNDNYAYFFRLFELGTPTADVNDTVNSIADFDNKATKESLVPYSDGSEVHFYDGKNGAPIKLTVHSLTIGDGIQRTIFVDGDLEVDGNIQIDPVVGQKRFLAFVVSGTITFATSVTQADGVYIAGARIDIPNTTTQFKGNGIFVGWGGVTLSRNLKTLALPFANNDNPAELFTYRPDFLINAPEGFKRAGIEWQEVEPGN